MQYYSMSSGCWALAQTMPSSVNRLGIPRAFSSGKMPTNKQIDFAMDFALQSDMLSISGKPLSEQGHQLVVDLRELIENAQVLLHWKNHRESGQNLIYWCREAAAVGNIARAATWSKQASRKADIDLQSLLGLGTFAYHQRTL